MATRFAAGSLAGLNSRGHLRHSNEEAVHEPSAVCAARRCRLRKVSRLNTRHIALVSILLVGLVGLVGLAGCGPFLVIPGGQLDGVSAAPPTDWSFTNEVDTVQLETNPEDPYSVNIWAVGMGPLLYVHAGANRAAWVEHMEADPRVRIRIEEKIYTLKASRVEGEDEFARFSDAYEGKYGSRPRNEDVTEAYLFRLGAP
jgi:hypothetical protein